MTFLGPFLPVLLCVVEILITADTKYTTLLQFLCQWNDVKVQKADFALVPVFCGICVDPPFAIGIVELFVEALVPFAVNLPWPSEKEKSLEKGYRCKLIRRDEYQMLTSAALCAKHHSAKLRKEKRSVKSEVNAINPEARQKQGIWELHVPPE